MLIGLSVFLLALTTINAQCSDSRTSCVHIGNCPSVIETLRRERPTLSAETRQRLRNLQCGSQGNYPLVCCPNENVVLNVTERTNSEIPPPPDVTNHPNLRLLNSKCGPITQPKVFGGNKTGVFEFPWMALIAYDVRKLYPEFRCGGTIISSRYILTAAHCVTSLPSRIRAIIGVRVGDHDVSKERDCDRDENGSELACAERYQDFGIESIHYHPNYSRTELQNDIALIRLNSSMDFRPRNVKAICLPYGTATKINQRRAIVTGWGATESGPRSQDLLQARLPLMTYEQCKEVYKSTIKIWHKQLCAGGVNKVDSCNGDSGGPLQAPGIYEGREVRMVQYGVISYGPQSAIGQCDIEGYPGVYTNVAYYVDWILDTMRD